MQPIYDRKFEGAEGLVKVWNNTAGMLQVCEDGHLLKPETLAWVESSEIVDTLVADGMLTLLSEPTTKVAKKNSKPKKTEEPVQQEQPVSESPSEPIQSSPVVQEVEEVQPEELVVSENIVSSPSDVSLETN
jgi:hypothetical protein